MRDLLNHLFQMVTGFQALAGREPVDLSPPAPEALTGDWRSRFGPETERLASAWSQPGALDGVSAGMGLPQLTVAHMVLGDLTLHGWDLARATGQPFTPDPYAVTTLIDTFAELAPQGRRFGAFGPEVPVAAEAPVFDRLLGVTGRDPAWTP